MKLHVIPWNASFLTAFRTFFTGWETSKTAQTVPVILYSFSRYMNVVANVLGQAGYHNTYEGGTDQSIYESGRAGNIIASDPKVATTPIWLG